jgi:hypothetical protein
LTEPEGALPQPQLISSRSAAQFIMSTDSSRAQPRPQPRLRLQIHCLVDLFGCAARCLPSVCGCHAGATPVRSLTLEPARVIRRDRFVPWYIYAHPRQNVRHMLAVLILLFVCEVGAMVACQKWRRVLLMLKVRSRVRTTTRSALRGPSSYAAKSCNAWTQPVATSVRAGSPRDQPLVCRLEPAAFPGSVAAGAFQ